MRRSVRTIILILCMIVIVCSGGLILAIMYGYHAGSQSYVDLMQYCHPPEMLSDVSPTETEYSLENSSDAFPVVDFEELRAINPDIIGWIQVPGTSINYPVVHGSDNDYYLFHLPDGTKNRCGSIFLDCRSDANLTNRHSIIHGHNMGDGSMFQDLLLYQSQEFMNSHPIAYLITPTHNYEIEFFAGSLLGTDADVWKFTFSGDLGFQEWIDSCISQSQVSSTLRPTASDRIVTLSTCSYAFHDARWVLQGVLRG